MAAARMHRETDFPMRFVPTIRRRLIPQGTRASTGQRRAAASLLTVIGPCQLVAGNPFPPLVSLYLNPRAHRRGCLFHEAAGCRNPRRFERIPPAGVVLFAGGVRRRSFPGRRVAELRAGRGF
jgi:hypothetical protein